MFPLQLAFLAAMIAVVMRLAHQVHVEEGASFPVGGSRAAFGTPNSWIPVTFLDKATIE